MGNHTSIEELDRIINGLDIEIRYAVCKDEREELLAQKRYFVRYLSDVKREKHAKKQPYTEEGRKIA